LGLKEEECERKGERERVFILHLSPRERERDGEIGEVGIKKVEAVLK